MLFRFMLISSHHLRCTIKGDIFVTVHVYTIVENLAETETNKNEEAMVILRNFLVAMRRFLCMRNLY